MKHIKQLDSIRAFAVCLVIFSHWITINDFVTSIELGAVGVDIFFVLSGFLITRILIDNRIKADSLAVTQSRLVKNFYVRRTLRIFPIYYLTIFVLLLFQKESGVDMQTAFVYLVTYTSNFYFFKIQHWSGVISHLWSLAVEEQFYLIWPWIILFANKKYFLHIIIAFISIGVLGQYLTSGIAMSHVLTFNCFDAFGLGALLAWQITFRAGNMQKFYTRVLVMAVVAAAFFIGGMLQREWVYVPHRTLVSLMALWLITYVVIHQDGNTLRFKWIFNNRVLIFLGKISYGIYLYHNIIPGMLNTPFISKYLNPLLPELIHIKFATPLFIIENAILVLIISWMSFRFIEKPFLNLKKYFEYKPNPLS